MIVEHLTTTKDWYLRPVVLKTEKWQIKPSGALFTCPKDSTHSWRQWCKENTYGHGDQVVTMKIDEADLLVIDSIGDAERLPWVVYPEAKTLKHVDWIGLKVAGIKAIWLTERGEIETRFHPPECNLYGWDCETVAILDESAIVWWSLIDGYEGSG